MKDWGNPNNYNENQEGYGDSSGSSSSEMSFWSVIGLIFFLLSVCVALPILASWWVYGRH